MNSLSPKLVLGAILLFLTQCCKDEAIPNGKCFNRVIIEDFFITSVDGAVVNPLNSEIRLNCRPRMGGARPCRVDIGGTSDGIRTQQCKFIYVFVKSTNSGEWFRQEISTSLMNGGDWNTNVQLGDSGQHLPFGLTFELVAIVTGKDLSNIQNPIDQSLEAVLPLDHKKTNFVRIYVEE